MKKLITLSLLIFLGYSSSFSQKKLKGKEIGIDLRNFNNNGNINFLIRKDTKDSLIKKRKNISFSFQNNSNFPNYLASDLDIIANEYKSATNNFGSINFAWGKEHYIQLDDISSKDIYFYHGFIKSAGMSNQTSQNLSLSYTNNILSSINKSYNNTVSFNLGLSLLGGLKYNFSPKIAIGIESGLHAGIRLGASESKSTQYTMSDKSSTDLNSTKSTSTSTFFNTNLINAIWFSYKF